MNWRARGEKVNYRETSVKKKIYTKKIDTKKSAWQLKEQERKRQAKKKALTLILILRWRLSRWRRQCLYQKPDFNYQFVVDRLIIIYKKKEKNLRR